MNVRIVGLPDDPYHAIVRSVVEHALPGSQPKGSPAQLDAVTAELLGTKQHRYGPLPDPESLVAIREVARESIAAGKSIPVLVPWGPYKQGPWNMDIAELWAVRQMKCLLQRVQLHHKPGIEFRIRLDQFVDKTLGDDPESVGARAKSEEYGDDLEQLMREMELPAFVSREASIADRDEFRERMEHNARGLQLAIEAPESSRKHLLQVHVPGWSGMITDEMVDYYLRSYQTLYPGSGREENFARLARYFGRSLARYQAGLSGADPSWGAYLTLAFSSTPWGRTGRRLFYRTLPVRFTHQHRAPWIAKGYVAVRGREAVPQIAGWSGDGLDYQKTELHFDAGLRVECDYVVES